MKYRDDVLKIYNNNEDQARELVLKLNEIIPCNKFTSETSNSQVTFLDLVIYKSESFQKIEGRLDTQAATKN